MKCTDPMLPNWSCWLLSFLQGKCSLYEPGCSQCPWKPLLRRCYFNIWRAVISFHKDSLFHRRNKHRIWQMQGRSEIFLCGGTERPIKLSCVPCIMVSGALDVFSENWFCGVTNSQLIILFLFLNTLCECHRMQREAWYYVQGCWQQMEKGTLSECIAFSTFSIIELTGNLHGRGGGTEN